MRQNRRSAIAKPETPATTSEHVVKDIRRATRQYHSTEEKIRIVLDGLRGEYSIAELCRRELSRTSPILRTTLTTPKGMRAAISSGGRSIVCRYACFTNQLGYTPVTASCLHRRSRQCIGVHACANPTTPPNLERTCSRAHWHALACIL
jgi:hypothetical protein